MNAMSRAPPTFGPPASFALRHIGRLTWHDRGSTVCPRPRARSHSRLSTDSLVSPTPAVGIPHSYACSTAYTESHAYVDMQLYVLRMTHEFNHPHARPASDFIVTPCADSRLVDPRVQCRPSARICDQTARPLEFGSSPENTCTRRRRLARARAVNVNLTSRADPRP